MIRARIQAMWDIQRRRFSNNGSDIICNTDMRVGEVWQFCGLQDEDAALTTAGSVEASEFDAGGDDAAQLVSAHDRGFGREGGNPVYTLGGGVTIQTQADVGAYGN